MPKIDTMFAFIAEEGPGEEGVCAFLNGETWFPMVGADSERIESLRDIARRIATTTGKKITLAHFSVRQDIEEIDP